MFRATLGVVVYRTRIELLEKLLKSVEASSLKPHVVFYCNGPDPSYRVKVRELANQYTVTLIDSDVNEGFGAGHNRILEVTDTEWYVCCNPDIELTVETLETMIRFGESREDLGLLTAHVIYPDGRTQPLSRKHITLFNWLHRQVWRFVRVGRAPFEQRFDYSTTQPIEFVTGCFFIARTPLLKKLGGFDSRYFLYCEDADLSRRAEKYGQNYYLADAQIIHAWQGSWRRSLKCFYHELRSLSLYFRRFGI